MYKNMKIYNNIDYSIKKKIHIIKLMAQETIKFEDKI